MATIFFCDSARIDDQDAGYLLHSLPGVMRDDITRYARREDQKNTLAGRLLLLNALRMHGNEQLIYRWKLDRYRKPFIEGWKPFNISHSGSLVVFSSSDSEVGIDIERNDDIDHTQVSTYFHPKEQNYILHASDRKHAFYQVWVKKEAFLKAIGTGIADPLDQYDCTTDRVHYDTKDWNFHRINIHPLYTCFLCSTEKSESCIPIEYVPQVCIEHQINY